MKMTVRLGLELNIIDEASCQTLVADTTVMEKAIAYPTDSRLFKRVQEQRGMLAKAQGIWGHLFNQFLIHFHTRHRTTTVTRYAARILRL